MTSPIAAGTQQYTPHARAERLIAAGRFVLASSSLAAIYLEPSTPARFQQPTYALLSIYAVYALVMMIVAWQSPVPSTRARLVTHALDLVLFSVFVYLTEGPASPFFLYFIFSLFCATLRFSWRGILATGIAAVGIYGAMAAVAALGDPQFETGRVFIREAYLGVIAALLVYLGMYQQRLRTELASLAAWPRDPVAALDELLHITLAHAAATLKSSRVLLLWEEREEPWVYTASWWAGTLDVQRAAPGVYGSIIAPELRTKSFYTRADAEEVLVYDPASSTAVELRVDAIASTLRERFAFVSAIGVSLESESVAGVLVHPDIRGATADDLALAHIAGRLVLATLDQFFYLQQVRQIAGAEERMRISRELHDGIVQSLGGAGLQLQAIRARLPEDSPEAERIAHVQRVLEHDQRELRTIVRELRPHDARDGRSILHDELMRIRERFPLEWGLAVDVELPPLDVPAGLAHELCRIANESLANAARHGGATHATVAVSKSGSGVHLSVRNNGCGFAFSGSYDLAALDRSGFGPRTLKERVAGLSGSLTVASSAQGASIDIRLPLEPEGMAP